MGTRNLTSVIMDGKQVVCQYCQWDGYPSYAGVKILEFLRDADMERFRKSLANTNITVNAYEKAFTYTGSTLDVTEIAKDAMKTQVLLNTGRGPGASYVGTYETVKHMLRTGQLTQQQADAFMASTRDTGCAILPYLYDRSLDMEPLQLFAIKNDFDGDYSFDIQGIYVIDLDNFTVKMRFNGYDRAYDMNNLPVQIALEMHVFEAITRQIDDLSYDKFHFASLLSEDPAAKDSAALTEKAKDIVRTIADIIKETEPELLSASKDTPLPDAFDLDYICALLHEKAVAEKQAQKPAFENQVKAAAASATPSAQPIAQDKSVSELER